MFDLQAYEKESFRSLFPFQPHFFETGNCRLHYVDEGTGPVLLLMHACPMWSFSFRRVIAEFSRTHRVIALDQAGFGLSDKPVDYDYRIETHVDHAERFIKTMGLKDLTLILHGRGSTIGTAYAVRHPDNVRAMVTLNAMAFSDFHLPLRLQICRIKWLGAKIVFKLNLMFRGTGHLAPAERAAYLYPFREPGSKMAILRFIEDIPCVPEDDSAQSMFEIESALRQLRGKPVAVLWAMKDWLYTRGALAKWRQYFPDGEFHPLYQAGRFVQDEVPDDLLTILTDFLQRHQL